MRPELQWGHVRNTLGYPPPPRVAIDAVAIWADSLARGRLLTRNPTLFPARVPD